MPTSTLSWMTAAAVLVTAPVSAQTTQPAEAGWIMNDGTVSRLVVRQPEGPPPGLDLPADAPAPPPPPELDGEVIGDPIPANVLEVEDQGEFTRVRTAYVPSYEILMTQEIFDRLSARPKFDTDFPNGIQASVGDMITFGQDIGYASETCAQDAGNGFWPPATFCATGREVDNFLPNTPEPATEQCYSTLADTGIFLNGTVLFNWSDGQSFRMEGNWHNVAHIYEAYDFDICQGHAVEGMYHHHGFSSCLQDEIGDEGTDHSPVWGYAADGYPIHGPWQAAGVLATSSWRLRDYASEAEGCGDPTARSCVMADAFDASSRTVEVAPGPDIGAEGQSMFSKNDITLENGAFLEDYVHDPSLLGAPESLDSFNGHSHGDFGYHYHLTVDEEMAPVFPYSFGPVYRGRLFPNALTSCGATVMEFPAPPIQDARAPAIDLSTMRWAVLSE